MGDQLPLIDEVDIAAQRRRRPGIAVDAQSLVRGGGRGHAHLADSLRAVERGHPGVAQQRAPGRVGDDHQLGDQLVERRTARPFVDAHAAGAVFRRRGPVDDKVVILALRSVLGLTAARFEHGRQFPEPLQFGGERKVAEPGRQRLLVENGLDVVVAQVGDDRHLFQLRLVAANGKIGGDIEIQRDGRCGLARTEREAFDHGLGQHGDLAAGHVHRRQPVAGDASELRIGGDAQARRGDVDADPHAAIRVRDDGEGVVDLRRMRVVDREGAHLGHGQLRMVGGVRESRKTCSGGKVLDQEAAEAIFVRIGNRAAAPQQPRRRQAGIATGRFQRLRFRAVAVRLVEQLRQHRREFGGQRAGLQFFDHALDGRSLLALLLETGQRRLQDLRRGLAEAPLALAVEVNRRRMQAQQQRRRFHGGRLAAGVVGGELLEAELGVRTGFPEEVDVDGGRFALGEIEQFRGRRRVEAQQDVGGLDLAALARGKLHLQRGVVVGHHDAGLEGAVFLEQDVHEQKSITGSR